jgi:hypothetical protein
VPETRGDPVRILVLCTGRSLVQNHEPTYTVIGSHLGMNYEETKHGRILVCVLDD